MRHYYSTSQCVTNHHVGVSESGEQKFDWWGCGLHAVLDNLSTVQYQNPSGLARKIGLDTPSRGSR